jgi:4-carboxymuconolactone decarboxylase
MAKYRKTAGFQAGLAVRREVLGDAYVDAALANADDFTREWQQYVTEHGWGAVWTRPGLPRHTRSLLNLVMLAALNRPNELKLHLRGAINNGVTRDEMKEAFLQVALYCGAPAALDAFKLAQQAFAELDANTKP